MDKLSCTECGIEFSHRQNLSRHETAKHRNASYRCETCGRNFNRKDVLLRHEKIHSADRKRRAEESTFIDLPPLVKKKHAIVNVQNSDKKCFVWAVLSALHPADGRKHGVSKYEPFAKTLDFTDIEFPVRLRDIERFEDLNRVSINVYGFDEIYRVFPLMVTKSECSSHVDLIYITNETTFHYAWIKNLSRLISGQVSYHHGRIYVCRRCLSYFRNKRLLAHHEKVCKNNPSTRLERPSKFVSGGGMFYKKRKYF